MADKKVFFKNLYAKDTTIGDFFYRLNNLRTYGGLPQNTLYVIGSYTDPNTGKIVFSANLDEELIEPFNIVEASKAALNTKNAISFLSSVNISPYDVSSLAFGAAIASKDSVAKVEKAIGLLESACVTFCSSNRVSNFTSNFTAVNKQGLTIFHSVNSVFCSNVGAGTGTSCPSNFTAVFNSVKNSNHASVNFSFGHISFDSSFTVAQNNGHKSGNFSTNGNVSNRSAGIQFNYTSFHMAQGGKKSAVHSSNNKSNFKNFASCKKNCSGNNGSNFTTYFKTVANYKTNRSPNAVASFSPNQTQYNETVKNVGFTPTAYFTNGLKCHSHNQSVDTTFNSTNRVGHNDAIIANISYHTNHSVFQVEGIDF